MYDLPRRNLFLLAEICMPFRSPSFFLLLNPAAAAACIQHFCYAPFAPPISSVVPPFSFPFFLLLLPVPHFFPFSFNCGLSFSLSHLIQSVGDVKGWGGGGGIEREILQVSAAAAASREAGCYSCTYWLTGGGRRWRHFIALCEGRRQPPAAGPAWFETTMTVLFCLQRGRGGGEWVMDDCKKGGEG